MLIVVKRLMMIVLMAAACPQPTRAQPSDRLAEFAVAPYVLGQLQQRRAIERGEMAVPAARAIVGYPSKPDGDGPFPAVMPRTSLRCAFKSAMPMNPSRSIVTNVRERRFARTHQ